MPDTFERLKAALADRYACAAAVGRYGNGVIATPVPPTGTVATTVLLAVDSTDTLARRSSCARPALRRGSGSWQCGAESKCVLPNDCATAQNFPREARDFAIAHIH